MNKTWTIVKFNQEDSVEAVPTTWILGNTCYWPPFTQQNKILTAIRNHESPNTCWPSHEISTFKNGTYDNYLEARRKCKIAECQSDLLSDDEDDNLRNRKIRNKKVISSSSCSEEDIIPDPPLPKTKLVPLKINEKHYAEERPALAPSCITTSTSDNHLVLTKLAADFETFTQCMRKQNILTNVLADILSEVTSLKKAIREMGNSKKLDASNIPESLNDKLTLPAQNMEDNNELENYLSTPENFPKVVEEMLKVGGNSPFDFIKRVLLQFMTYKVASLYTWHGTKEKSAFKSTKMSQIIIRASTNIATQKDIEDALQKFFRRAKERSNSGKAN